MVRKQFEFSGYVQGVGFRYTAQILANKYRLTGWVRNEYDGSVTMVLQGGESEISALLNEIEGQRYIRIEDVKVTYLEPLDDERTFSVKY